MILIADQHSKNIYIFLCKQFAEINFVAAKGKRSEKNFYLKVTWLRFEHSNVWEKFWKYSKILLEHNLVVLGVIFRSRFLKGLNNVPGP